MPSRCRHAAALLCLPLAILARPAFAETFTIAVVPDPQHYSDVTTPQPRGAETFAREMAYIADSRAKLHIVFTTFVGDIVQHGDGRFHEQADGGGAVVSGTGTTEWDNAERAIAALDGAMPFGMSPGNHDYDNYSWWNGEDSPGASRPLDGSRTWTRYFGPRSHHFAGKGWYGGASGNGMNSFQTFTGGGIHFLHLSLEMEPPESVIDWAQHVIDTHPGLPVIMTTHEWLVPTDSGNAPQPRSNGHEAFFPGSDHLAPDTVWDRLIRTNPRIFLVLCGHNYTPAVNGVSQGENLRIDRDDAGYPVYQILQDYQGNTVGRDGQPGSANGGAGWLRFLSFDTARRKIHAFTYSTLADRYAGRNGEATFGIAAGHSDFELDFPPQLTGR